MGVYAWLMSRAGLEGATEGCLSAYDLLARVLGHDPLLVGLLGWSIVGVLYAWHKACQHMASAKEVL